MAQHLIELCSIIVEESFGDVAAYIWSYLAHHGRTQFAVLSERTHVGIFRLAPLLPILILNRAIVYYVDPDYNATWYSVDLEGTYNLLRMSRLGDIVKERCGKDAAHVITNMAQLGHFSVGALISAYGLREQQSTQEVAHTNSNQSESQVNGSAANGTTTQVNGHATEAGTNQVNGDAATSVPKDITPIKSLDQLYKALTTLVREGFLIKAKPKFFHTAYDLQQVLEKEVQEEQFSDGKITGPKASQQYNAAVRDRKRKQREDDFDLDAILPGEARANKRQKTASGSIANHTHQLEDDLILTVNMRKYVVASRSRSYVKTATAHLGRSSGAVYSSLLQTLEKQIPEITYAQRFVDPDAKSSDDEDSDLYNPRATVTELYNTIDRNVDLTSSIKVSAKDLPAPVDNKPAFRQVKEDFSAIGIKPEPESDDDDHVAELDSFANRAKMCDLIERHLQSIEEHPMQFCQREGLGKPSVWSVDFADLTDLLIQAEIDNSITARFGRLATRLVRLLRDKGRLEEKQISAYAFMQMNTVRTILTELYAAGYVETQEIAKDSTRQPAKALYLWYFDVAKVQRMMIHQCYQSMSRAYQRLATERRNFQTVITKAHRFAEAKFFGDNYHRARRRRDDDDDDDDNEKDNQGGFATPTNASGDPIRFVLGQTGLWNNEGMNNIEKQQIREWKGIEANFLGQIMRLDDVILLLRDFSGQYNTISA